MSTAKSKVVALDIGRTAEFLSHAAWTWQTRPNGFMKITSAEELFLPDNLTYGSRQHALFLWTFGFFSRHGQKAYPLARWLKMLHEDDPGFFDPFAEDLDPELAHEHLNGLTASNDACAHWLLAQERLRKEFEGDPRNIFYTAKLPGINNPGHLVECYHSLMDQLCFCRNKGGFKGVSYKIASLITNLMTGVDWPESEGGDLLAFYRLVPVVPVDHWMLTLLFQCGCVSRYVSEYRSVLGRPISIWLAEICAYAGIDHRQASLGVYHAGALRCFRKPKDSTKQSTYCAGACPFDRLCTKTVNTNESHRRAGKIAWLEAEPRLRLHLEEKPE